MDHPGHGVAEFEFVIADRMSTDDGATRFRHFRETAAQDLFEDFRRTGSGERQDRERGNWPAAHGIHIAERVGGSDLAEKLRIIENGREKIHGLNYGEIVCESIYGCIVAGFKTDDDVRINLRWKALEHRVENAGAQFRSAARSFCGGGEPDEFRQGHFSVEQIE
jgi:hypothetical protein